MANPVDPRANLPAISTGGSIAPLIPTTFREALEMAQVFAKSQGVPKAYQGKPDDIVVAIMHGMEVGLPPLASVQNIATINGKPSLYGDAQLAVVMGSGLLEDIEETNTGEGDQMKATCRVRRKGVATEAINTFSVADARRAGLWGKAGPWTQHPKRMLKFRARSYSLRDLFADRLLGISSAEEAQDAGIGPDGARDVTPERPRPASKLDALEGIIDAETPPANPDRALVEKYYAETPEPVIVKTRLHEEDVAGIITVGGDLANLPDTYDRDTGEVFETEEEKAKVEKMAEVEVWANKMIGQFGTVTDAIVIDRWLTGQKNALAKAHEINPDATMAVIAAADQRKKKIEQDKFTQQENDDGA